MTKRHLLATATLAALPALSVMTTVSHQLAQMATEPSAHTVQLADTPQWSYALGMEGETALAFGVIATLECALFGPVGGVACGIAGAL